MSTLYKSYPEDGLEIHIEKCLFKGKEAWKAYLLDVDSGDKLGIRFCISYEQAKEYCEKHLEQKYPEANDTIEVWAYPY